METSLAHAVALPRQSLSHYTIVREIGRGGVGVVYYALDTTLHQRPVALKVLPWDLRVEPEAQRFNQEAASIALLNHPNIAHIYEVGEADGTLFIAMEYVEGETLQSRINRGRLGVREILEIGTQLAEALECTHSKGIIHRDIKPSNIMLTTRGLVKVLDFGIAKMASLESESGGGACETITRTGVVFGTVQYMSPEQTLGAKVDQRSDIFSLGVVLYEMACGGPLFAGTTPSQIIARILHDSPPALRTNDKKIPAGLERLILKCLEKDKDRRYGSAAELLEDLRRIKQRRDVTGFHVPRKWLMTTVLTVFFTVALMIVLGQLSSSAARLPMITDTELPQSRKTETEPTDAKSWYLKGKYHWGKRTHEGLNQAILHYKRAVEIDPAFAAAHAGLAEAFMLQGGIVTPREIYPKAKAAALRAIELNPSLPEAHAALAYIALHYDWDWLNAEREYKRAIDLNPKYPTAHSSYARFLTAMGRFDEALKELGLAQKLDPVGLGIATGVGLTLYMARRYDKAIAQYSKVIELEPNYALARFNLGGALAQRSRLPEAIASFEAGFRIAKTEAGSLGELGNAYALLGKRQEALGTLEKLEKLRSTRYVSPYFSALVYAGLRDNHKSLESLDRAFEDRSSSMAFLKVEPRFDPLRREPRFQELVKLVGLRD